VGRTRATASQSVLDCARGTWRGSDIAVTAARAFPKPCCCQTVASFFLSVLFSFKTTVVQSHFFSPEGLSEHFELRAKARISSGSRSKIDPNRPSVKVAGTNHSRVHRGRCTDVRRFSSWSRPTTRGLALARERSSQRAQCLGVIRAAARGRAEQRGESVAARTAVARRSSPDRSRNSHAVPCSVAAKRDAVPASAKVDTEPSLRRMTFAGLLWLLRKPSHVGHRPSASFRS